MTYDVQRYALAWNRDDGSHFRPANYGSYVIASEAEAHERAAVEAARAEWEANGPYFTSVVHACCEEKQTSREQAIRDCIAAVEAQAKAGHGQAMPGSDWVHVASVLAALRALLDKP